MQKTDNQNTYNDSKKYKFTSIRWIDGKQKKVIVDICGNIVNRDPTKEELRDLRPELPIRELFKILSESEKREYLLEFLIYFNDKEGKPPTTRDFSNNHKCPNYIIYAKVFGSWENALKLVGLDVDSMVIKGFVKTTNQKARLAEIKVIDHFKNNPIDLSGKNCNSPYDGICPNGKTYDVKSSKLRKERNRYGFSTVNKHKDAIEIYYFLGFNEDYSEVEHAWRVPGEIVDRDIFYITKINSNRGSRNIESMKEYEITDKIKEIISKK